AARALAKRGATVAVLESETIGWGASSRNGGMVLTGLKLGVNKLVSMYGHERTQQMYAASLASIDCVEQIVREENIACDFAHCGPAMCLPEPAATRALPRRHCARRSSPSARISLQPRFCPMPWLANSARATA